MSHRLCLANQKFNANRRVLITKNSSFQHRYEILRSRVFQTVLWTSESWMVTKKLRSQLRGAETKLDATDAGHAQKSAGGDDDGKGAKATTEP